MNDATSTLTRQHMRRLRDIYRSSGWPCHDMLEIELLSCGMLERLIRSPGCETLRLTDNGIQQLAQAFADNKAARSAHELLVERVALEMARSGRIVWRGLALRAPLEKRDDEGTKNVSWVMACPDVFSIRNTSVQAYLEPVVHEIKVTRADLLGDLRKPAKRQAYMALGGQCWYVLGQTATGKSIAQPDEIPVECGVMMCEGSRLVIARPAPCKPVEQVPFHVWMALAKATPAWLNTGEQQHCL